MLINCDTGQEKLEKEILKVLPKDIKHEFHNVYGVYDLILEIQGMNDLNELSDKMKSIQNISSIILSVPRKHKNQHG